MLVPDVSMAMASAQGANRSAFKGNVGCGKNAKKVERLEIKKPGV